MLRQIAVFSLLFMLLLQSSSRIVIVSMWWVKKDYISKNLCINRMKPMLHCDGKCFLMTKLREAEQRQKDQMPELKNFQEMFIIKPEHGIVILIENHFQHRDLINADHNFSISQPHLRSIFNPPEVS